MNRFATLGAIALLTGTISTVGQGQLRLAPQDSLDWLQSVLGDFRSDSMRSRQIGSSAHAHAIDLVRIELRALARRAGSRVAFSEQLVPFAMIAPDTTRSTITLTGKLAFGTDYVPLSGYGLEPPTLTEAASHTVGLGRMGSNTSPASGAANGKFAVIFPPRRPDGEPEYQLSALLPHLRTLDRSKAILVASRDLMPRRVLDRLLSPRLVVTSETPISRAGANDQTPVVLAITRSLAGHWVRDGARHHGSIRIAFKRDSLAHRAHNLIAILPGQDPALRSEYVLLVAHTDTFFETSDASLLDIGVNRMLLQQSTASVGLLALAQQLASSDVPLRRSVLFLWASGYDRGQLGLHFFLDRGSPSATSIASIVSMDQLGTGESGDSSANVKLAIVGSQPAWTTIVKDPAFVAHQMARTQSGDPYSPEGCNGVLAQAARRGIPAFSIGASERGPESLRGGSPHSTSQSVTQLMSVVKASSKFVQLLANADALGATQASVTSATCQP